MGDYFVSEEINERSASELFAEFKVMSISEFFKKNKAMLGYTGKIRSLTTVIHEGITNGIDAAEEAGILPEIKIQIFEKESEHYRVIVEDNATGIPEEFIPQVFGRMLAGSKAHRRMQSRGQQGIGISGAVMFSQLTTGQYTEIYTSTGTDSVLHERVKVDVEKNTGKIKGKTVLKNNGWRGTKVELDLKEVVYNRSKYGPYYYTRMTSMANPHLKLTIVEPDGKKTVFDRVTDIIPKPPIEIPPHPYGVGPDDILSFARFTDKKKLTSFLTDEFCRISGPKAKETCELAGLLPTKKPQTLEWADAEAIVNAFNQIKFYAPPTEGLQPIGQAVLEEGIRQILEPEYVSAMTRSPTTYKGGIPFLVEVSLAYGGRAGAGEGKMEILRFANRAPLLFEAGACAITEAVRKIDWKRYGVRDADNSPLTVLVNLVSPHIPYISAGKTAIADEKEIVKEVRYAIMEIGRRLSLHLSRKLKIYEKTAKRKTVLKYVNEVAGAISKLTGNNDQEVAQSLSNLVDSRFA